METKGTWVEYEQDEYTDAMDLLVSLGIEPSSDKVKDIIEAANGKYDEERSFRAAVPEIMVLKAQIVEDAINIIRFIGEEPSIGKVKKILNIVDAKTNKELIKIILPQYEKDFKKYLEVELDRLDAVLKADKTLQREIVSAQGVKKAEEDSVELSDGELRNVEMRFLTGMSVVKLASDTGDSSIERIESIARGLNINITKDEIEATMNYLDLIDTIEALNYALDILKKLGQKPSVEAMLKIVRAAGVEPGEEFAPIAAEVIEAANTKHG